VCLGVGGVCVAWWWWWWFWWCGVVWCVSCVRELRERERGHRARCYTNRHPTRRPAQQPTNQRPKVAGRTNDAAGDGTTTAACLAREMIHFGLQCVTAGANPISVKKGIDKTSEFLVGKLRENAKPVQGRNDIKVRRGYGLRCWSCSVSVGSWQPLPSST
jgi:hypothetical protein